MIKQDLQSELLAKVKLGTKPSQLKKSKSLSDLPAEKTKDTRRNSVEPIINANTLKAQLTEAQDEISILALKVETQSRELTEFKAENAHLKEQAEIKQKDLESLRKEVIRLTCLLGNKDKDIAKLQEEIDVLRPFFK